MSHKNTFRLGRSYERCVKAFCRKKGLRIVQQNLRQKSTEIDCLAWDPQFRRYWVIEVRGRSNARYRPSHCIGPRKLKKLRDFAFRLSCEKKTSVKICLLEVIGKLPVVHAQWGLEWFPERLGLILKDYEIEAQD